MRFCRAEMPSYCVKALENTQSILCGLFLVCEHFCSGRTASHRTALDFRGIFVLFDAGGLSPAKEKRVTRLSAWLTRMGSPPMVQLNRYRLSVRSPSTQNRPMPYHRK